MNAYCRGIESQPEGQQGLGLVLSALGMANLPQKAQGPMREPTALMLATGYLIELLLLLALGVRSRSSLTSYGLLFTSYN